jgi:hypothetical protein
MGIGLAVAGQAMPSPLGPKVQDLVIADQTATEPSDPKSGGAETGFTKTYQGESDFWRAHGQKIGARDVTA